MTKTEELEKRVEELENKLRRFEEKWQRCNDLIWRYASLLERDIADICVKQNKTSK